MEEHSNGATTITLAGATYRVHIPRSFADREDVVAIWGGKNNATRSRRVFGATLAVCVPEIAALAKVAIPDDGDLMPIGKAVYDVLRGKGSDNAAIAGAASACFALLAKSLFPRADAVEAKEVFSEGAAGPT